ncbi:MAG: DUF393 domain-containing protein [Myxococcota bacterium]
MSGKLLVVFDGQCGLCQSSVGWLTRFDPGEKHLEFIPYQDEEGLKARAPEMDPARADREMLVRTDDGHVHGGFFALRQIARKLPRLWPVVPFLYFPVVSRLVGPPIYRVIARYRRQIMGTAVCQIPNRARS